MSVCVREHDPVHTPAHTFHYQAGTLLSEQTVWSSSLEVFEGQ